MSAEWAVTFIAVLGLAVAGVLTYLFLAGASRADDEWERIEANRRLAERYRRAVEDLDEERRR